MKKFIIIFKIFLVYFFLTSYGLTKESNYLKKGIDLFQKKEYDKSKLHFEKDIVLDPKSEKSYLYLSKIFNIKENDEEEEVNLNNVLLLNPQNDEAVYLLTLLKIKQFDYNEAKNLAKKFNQVCNSFCSKKKKLKKS